MSRLLGIIFIFLVFCSVSKAEFDVNKVLVSNDKFVNDYLKKGYKVHSINTAFDQENIYLYYHLIKHNSLITCVLGPGEIVCIRP